MANFVNVIISGNSRPLRNALDKAALSMTGFQKKVALGFVAAGAASMAFAASAVKAAAKDQVAMTELERQIKASTGATEEQIKAQEKFLKTVGRASAFSKSALIPGYQSLIVATRDAAKAQEIMGVAVDVARARHLDLSTVSEALAKAYAGNTRALRQLSPEMKKLIADGATFDQVITRLNQNFGGAASEYAKTFQGRLDILGNSVNALKKQIGMALLPVAEKLVPVLQAFVDTLAQHPTLVKTVAIGIGTLAGAFALATTAVAVYAVGVKAAALANAVFASSELAVAAANPFTAAWAAVAAAGLSILINKAYNAVKANYDHAASLGALKTATDNMIDSQAELNNYMGPVASRNFAELKKHTADYNASLIKSQTEADKAKQKESERYKTFVDRLASAKKAVRDYVNAIRDQIASSVSLSTAFSEASSAQSDYESKLQSALDARKQAYADLNQAQQTNDVQAYNEALGKVTEAEAALTEVQKAKPKSYMAIFQEQISAAKEFAGNLKTLIGQGLGKAGLQQLLDLGPVAGNAVAKDLIAGTGGYTTASLNADLSAIQAAATSVGMAIPGVAATLSATAGKTVTNQYQITVTAGVGNKVEIAKQVVEVLQEYERQLGGIPIKVKK